MTTAPEDEDVLVSPVREGDRCFNGMRPETGPVGCGAHSPETRWTGTSRIRMCSMNSSIFS